MATRPTENTEAQGDETDKQEFLALALKRWQLAADAESEIRREALDDLQFSIGQQWPADIESARQVDGRPCLTMNRLPQFIRQVTNQERELRPGITVNPVGSGADPDTAEIIQGLVRHIEINSDSELAYDTGFDYAVRGGWGYWRVLTDYEDDGATAAMELKIAPIYNPFSVYEDPASKSPDGADAKWAFIVEDVPLPEFREQNPDAEAASLSQMQTIGDQAAAWITKDYVRVAEYMRVVEENVRYAVRADGSVVEERELADGEKPKRTITKVARRVLWSKITAVDILEEREWPGRWLPLIRIVGDDIDVNGRRHLSGLVRDAKDPQRAYNYWESAATEMIALAPKAPWVGAEGQFEGHEEQWRQANTKNFAYLEYKGVSAAGQPVGPPQRNVVEPPIQAMALMIKLADNDLKSTTGLFDASLGAPGPEQSGKAILARQRQGDVATFNFADNLARSIRHTGRILVDVIPKIYDAPRIARIIRPDQTVDQVAVWNSKAAGAVAPHELPELQEFDKVYDLGVGRYDVTVTVGPSYQSKRQEAATSMMSLVQAYPPVMQAAGDLLVASMDWPGAQQIAERLRKLLPPALQENDNGEPDAQAAQLKAQLAQFVQQNAELAKALNEASEIIKTKRLENESKERIALFQAQAEMISADLKAKAQAAQAVLEENLGAITKRLDLLNNQVSMGAEARAALAAPSPVPGGTPGQPTP